MGRRVSIRGVGGRVGGRLTFFAFFAFVGAGDSVGNGLAFGAGDSVGEGLGGFVCFTFGARVVGDGDSIGMGVGGGLGGSVGGVGSAVAVLIDPTSLISLSQIAVSPGRLFSITN